jgi:hypothetical protein
MKDPKLTFAAGSPFLPSSVSLSRVEVASDLYGPKGRLYKDVEAVFWLST